MDSPLPSVDVALNGLVGCPLTSVTFVMDYLQIGFEGDVLTVLTNPDLLRGEEEISWGSSDFANALRQQIGKALRRVDVSGTRLRLTFENGHALNIPLEVDPPRVEHIIFQKDGKTFWVG
jgi:hypothetical protein